MRRFTVMGFTEAEVGFVIAALFAAIAVAMVHERDAAVGTEVELKALRAEVKALKDELETRNERIRVLEKELEALRTRVSTKTPQCWEKGQSRDAVAVVTVAGDNRYEIDDRVLTIDDVTRILADKLELGSSLGCRFVLRARPMPGVDAIEHSAAVNRLRRFFDVDDRPR